VDPGRSTCSFVNDRQVAPPRLSPELGEQPRALGFAKIAMHQKHAASSRQSIERVPEFTAQSLVCD
jgi:hypothetical protein